jgi:hypothetical protein
MIPEINRNAIHQGEILSDPQQEILQLQKSSGTIPLINWMSAKEWCLTV